MKKFLSAIMAITLMCSCFLINSNASFNSLMTTEADIMLLVNLDDNTVILDKNADKRSAPASLAKIVTCILALDNCSDLSTEITCRREVLGNLYQVKASVAGIRTGETLTMEQLLYCLMVASAGDAANIIADYIGGSIEQFVVMMNDFAKSLGCNDTNFTNANGLDDGDQMYTTANDLYKITSYALKNEKFREIVDAKRYDLPPTNKCGETRHFQGTNKMMNSAFKDYYCPYVSGVKTGTTELAGHCVITTASKDGYNYLLIVMNAPQYDIDDDGVDENVAFTDSKKIYEWAFKNMVLQKVTNTTDVITVVDVKYNWKVDHLRLVPESEMSALVPRGTETGSLIVRPIEDETPKTVKAPIKKGDVIGKAEILYGEDSVGTVNLVSAEDIDRDFTKFFVDGIKAFFGNIIVKILIGILIVLVIIYILLIIRKNRIKKKRKKIRMIKG